MSSLNVALVQPKGGAGKTTTTVGVAQALAHRGVKVAVVDYDPMGGTSLWLKSQPHDNIILRSSADEELPEDVAIQLIDSEGRSRFEQVLKTLPDIGVFIIPCSPAALEIEGAKSAVQYIREFRPRSTVRLFWNRLNVQATNAQPETLAERTRHIGIPAFKTTFPRTERMADAPEQPWMTLRSEHRQLWENLAIELLTLLAKR